MEWSTEQVSWLVKVLQPERTVSSLPGGRTGLDEGTRAALLGLAANVYSTEHARLVRGAKEAARELLADPAVCSIVDRLPLKKGGTVVAFGDSYTSDPQSWAAILSELLAAQRPNDRISVVISAVSGETSTHGLIRIGEVVSLEPDWVLFFIGANDARTQGPTPSKTLVHHEETARNLAELQRRVSRETNGRCLWISPPSVVERRVESHWALSRFGVRFCNDDVARVADAVRKLDAPHIDLFSVLGDPPPADLVTDDGLHFTLAGQKRIALEIVRGWSTLVRGGGLAT
jgi:lysophospholipase L1-like esterase